MTTPIINIDEHLTSPAFYANPYPLYHQLRGEQPVFWSEALGGWLLTRYDDVHATLRDTEHFSSRGRMLSVLNHLPDEERARLRLFEEHFTVGLISADPPDHTRLRGLISKAFTPRTIEGLRPRIQALVDELLDQAVERGEMDLIRDFAYPLPATVIAELLGAPPEARDRFKVWTEQILSFQGTGRVTVDVLEKSQRGLHEMRDFLAALLDERRRRPQGDLLSRMVAAEAEGDKLTSDELLTTCVTLLTAGHETTTNLIGNGLYTLLRHPDQLHQLREQVNLMPGAIEEMLRYESPLQRNPRRVAEDVELHGQTLRRGDYVLQILGSANRDPARFPAPDQFDITRQPNPHVAFGFGVHFCLGAPLARLEAPIAIETILRRLPQLRLATESVQWHEHGLLRGLQSLPVTF